jgi:nitrite reductase (NO-forming)
MSNEPQEERRRIARRNFIGGGFATVALAGAGLGLAACSGGGGAGTATAAPSDQDGGGFAPGPKPEGKITNPRDATLPAVEPSPKQLTYRALNNAVEIAAGVKYNSFTFEGTVPGPVLHLKQGDEVNFTLSNEAAEGHSIDFHAAQTPWDKNYVTIPPGQTLSFDWKANLPGVFVYHCGTAPVLHHIANGMYGLIIVDPDPPLEPAREYWLIESEFYAKAGEGDTWDPDMDKMLAPRPDIVAFNGAAFQYKDNPLPAKAGEKIRLYVGNIGPTLFSAFHVIGALFDRVLVDGNPANVLHGIQTYTVPPGGGSTFELTIPDPGLYPIVTHVFAYTELGAVGLLEVT